MPKITYTLPVEFQDEVKQLIPVVTKGDTLELFFKIRDSYKVGLADITQAIVVFNNQEAGEKYTFDGEFIQVEEQVRLYMQAVEMLAGDYIVKTFLYNAAGERVSTLPIAVKIVEEI